MAKQGLEALATERRHRQAVAEAEGLFKQGGAATIDDALEKYVPCSPRPRTE